MIAAPPAARSAARSDVVYVAGLRVATCSGVMPPPDSSAEILRRSSDRTAAAAASEPPPAPIKPMRLIALRTAASMFADSCAAATCWVEAPDAPSLATADRNTELSMNSANRRSVTTRSNWFPRAPSRTSSRSLMASSSWCIAGSTPRGTDGSAGRRAGLELLCELSSSPITQPSVHRRWMPG